MGTGQNQTKVRVRDQVGSKVTDQIRHVGALAKNRSRREGGDENEWTKCEIFRRYLQDSVMLSCGERKESRKCLICSNE